MGETSRNSMDCQPQKLLAATVVSVLAVAGLIVLMSSHASDPTFEGAFTAVPSELIATGEKPIPPKIQITKTSSTKYTVTATLTEDTWYSVKLDFPKFQNMKSSTSQRIFNIKQGTQTLLSIEQDNKQGAWSYSWKYSYTPGFSGVSPSSTAFNLPKYLIPWSKDSQYKVSQGYMGTFSHQNQDAIDFVMPVGTPIFAARGGKVLDVKGDSNEGGPTAAYGDKANKVVIGNSDGSKAYYFHMKYNGPRVVLGQEVEAGQLIGYSGNTGWSTGPHLHFMVYQVSDPSKEATTVPITFENKQNNDIKGSKMKIGEYYYGDCASLGKSTSSCQCSTGETCSTGVDSWCYVDSMSVCSDSVEGYNGGTTYWSKIACSQTSPAPSKAPSKAATTRGGDFSCANSWPTTGFKSSWSKYCKAKSYYWAMTPTCNYAWYAGSADAAIQKCSAGGGTKCIIFDTPEGSKC